MPVSKMTVHFPCPVERVWNAVTDLAHTNWRSDIVSVEVMDTVHFAEHTKSGYTTNFTVTACKPLRFWAFTRENENMFGSWEGVFDAEEGGICLTCTETVTAKRWWMRPFVPGYLKRQQKRYLEDLRKELMREKPLCPPERKEASHESQTCTRTGY